jgi:diguanylate cyclase (GGDEF)-like protein
LSDSPDPIPAPNEAEESTAEVMARADRWAREGRVYEALSVYRALALRLDWERGRLEAERAPRRAAEPAPIAAAMSIEAVVPASVPMPADAIAPPSGDVVAPAPAAADHFAGMADRRQLEAFVAELPDATLTLLVVDVDRLQRINDGWSRDVGDAVLAQCVQLLRAQSRPRDILTRLDGAAFAAAFVVIFSGPVSLTRATLVAERLRAAIERHDWSRVAAGLTVTASIGVAACAPGEALDAALVRADSALAECKRTGRNQVRCAS